MQDSYGIAAFRSRQQALLLESALRREGIRTGIISTPRDVALGCGLSVRFDLEDQEKVLRAVRRTQANNMVGVYRVDREKGRTRLTALRRSFQ